LVEFKNQREFTNKTTKTQYKLLLCRNAVPTLPSYKADAATNIIKKTNNVRVSNKLADLNSFLEKKSVTRRIVIQIRFSKEAKTAKEFCESMKMSGRKT